MRKILLFIVSLLFLFVSCEDDKKVQPDTVTDIDGNVYQTVCI